MVRLIGILVGIFFSGWLLVSLAVGFFTWASEPKVETAEHVFHEHPKALHLASDGPFGHFDLQQVQRGYKVYKEVCSACHSLRHVAFRDLEQLGYTEAQVKAEAATWMVPGIDPVTGEDTMRAALPTDYFPKPYPNDVAARAANNNAIPPDLSLMAKARHNGDAYVYSLLTGYQEQPAELLEEFPEAKTPDGLHYNPYFPNLNLAMAQPLMDGQVDFDDGSPNDLDSMSQDLAAFLVWTAEPTLAKRHATGWPVVLFLLIATVLAYLAYRNVWRNEKH
ncbi:cytochrome c1 [Croceicoccus gelatinilyticus]|uniref:cytochrome c1 n=1 Tax=Croceicoccus gelatinilyticus TaxID=2835536 RepID=UPI001BD009A8|nr:cytochrome c1 [Croceicoccus gelatinilyticus]MBS7669380.1 cytochrome c1 [Croceicoccus gelatinilyticus]